MSYLILGVLLGCLGYYVLTKSPSYSVGEPVGAVLIIIAVISFASGVCMFAIGVDAHPKTLSKQEFVLSLKSEIETIRNSTYESKTSGSLISGSIENMQQSTQLSKYVSSCANHKANFNSYLKYNQLQKELFILRWFGYGMFIDKGILNLKPIE